MFESYDDLVTIEDLCEMLGIGKNAAYELLHKKMIKSFHIGRSWKIPKKAVEEYIYLQSGIKKQT
ncbi:MAG: helix-turn-helix domain-containing protein [Hungatella sp.]|nr:helix-turn-helix domain-containing protein [Hungatella sp.]